MVCANRPRPSKLLPVCCTYECVQIPQQTYCQQKQEAHPSNEPRPSDPYLNRIHPRWPRAFARRRGQRWSIAPQGTEVRTSDPGSRHGPVHGSRAPDLLQTVRFIVLARFVNWPAEGNTFLCQVVIMTGAVFRSGVPQIFCRGPQFFRHVCPPIPNCSWQRPRDYGRTARWLKFSLL
jgi:hypothetical protein